LTSVAMKQKTRITAMPVPHADDSPAIFLSPGITFHADRCEPLLGAVERGEVSLNALARRGYPGRPMPRTMMPEISTVGLWNAVGPQTWGLNWHRNEGVEFTYLSGGHSTFLVEDKRYQLESGHLTITRPWQRHKLGNPTVDPSRLHWFILDVGVRRPDQPWHWPEWLVLSPSDLQSLSTLLRHNENPVWQASPDLGVSFDRIARLLQTPDPSAIQSRLQLCLNEILLEVLELLQKKKVVLDARLATARRTVEMFLAALPEHIEHPWTLDEMAENCGLGRSRFAGYCRQIVNATPTEYLTNCRVEAALKMLSQSDCGSMTDIALACGFQSSQYFATVFRLRTGKSPREIRRGRVQS